MTLAEQGRMLRLASLFLLSGCVGDLVELTPGSAHPDMTQGAVDLLPPAGNQDMGGGTADLAQAAPHFAPTLQADIDSLGCSAASCHGGTQIPLLKRLPITQADIDANYAAFKAEAVNGEQSNILVKNLAGSGVTHTGGSSFAAESDPIYQRWLAWINGGTPE
jgi:hypothetical protein